MPQEMVAADMQGQAAGPNHMARCEPEKQRPRINIKLRVDQKQSETIGLARGIRGGWAPASHPG